MTMSKIESLSGLKLFALFLIVYGHLCSSLYGVESLLPYPNVDLGARGCELLYVISGFLVAYNHYGKFNGYFTESITYYFRKRSQMYDLNAITMLVSMSCLGSIIQRVIREPGIVLSNLFNVQCWTGCRSYNGATWFLCPLLAGYLLAPFWMKTCKNYKSTVLATFVLLLARFIIEYENGNSWQLSMHTNPIVRILEMLCGMSLGVIYMQISIKNTFSLHGQYVFLIETLIEVLVIFVTVAAYILFNGKWMRWQFFMLACLVCTVFSFGKGLISIFMSNRIFNWLSNYQMEFFIIHQPIMYVWAKLFAKYNIHYSISTPCILAIVLFLSVIHRNFLYPITTKYYKKFINSSARKLDIAIRI